MFTACQIPCLTAPSASMPKNKKSKNKGKCFSFTDRTGDTLHEHSRQRGNEVGENNESP